MTRTLPLLLLACNEQALTPLPDPCDEPAIVEAPAPIHGRCRAPALTTPSAAPWSVATRWSWPTAEDGFEGLLSGVGAAAVGPLVDSDGNGVVDADDAPAVVVGFVRERPLLQGVAALDGATGRPLWVNTDGPVQGSPAIADVDGDGLPEVLIADAAGGLTALRGADGAPLWSSVELQAGARSTPAVADLDGDGEPEVLAGNAVLRGGDGRVLFALPAPPGSFMSAADLDRDGTQEILANGTVFGADGAERWAAAETGDNDVAPS